MPAAAATDAERVARLTDGQKQCLRLVYRHMSSKDIARELGISPHSVDARLRSAIRTMGVATRTDAALRLAAHEAGAPYQSPAYQLPHVAGAPASVMLDPDTNAGRTTDEERDLYRMPDQEGHRPFHDTGPVARPSARPPTWGGRNDLSIGARVGVMLAIAIGSALAFGAILAGLEALAQLG